MSIRKSRCIKSDRTHCCIEKFNAALSLCRVLEVALYFSKSFSKAATRRPAVVKALQSLRVTVVCFLEQKSNLWFPTLQQRYRLFLRYFLYLSLVNLPLLARLEERSTYGELNCFLGTRDKNSLKEDNLVDETTKDRFALFWEVTALPVVEALSCF